MKTYIEGGDVCVGFTECRCASCIVAKRAKILADRPSLTDAGIAPILQQVGPASKDTKSLRATTPDEPASSLVDPKGQEPA